VLFAHQVAAFPKKLFELVSNAATGVAVGILFFVDGRHPRFLESGARDELT